MTLLLGMLAVGTAMPVWATPGTWVGQLPRQTVVVSQRPLEGAPIQPPEFMAAAEIVRVHWEFHLDKPAPRLKAWLCQGELCLPLVRSRGETQRFSGRPASIPFHLRFQQSPGKDAVGSLVVSGGQLIVDYRSGADKQRK